MRYRKLTVTGDYTLGHGELDWHVDTPAAPLQSVLTRLRLWLGEWFLDLTEGTRWMEDGLGSRKDATIQPMVRARIAQTEGVTAINRFEIIVDRDKRSASMTATISTIFGEGQVDTIFSAPSVPVIGGTRTYGSQSRTLIVTFSDDGRMISCREIDINLDGGTAVAITPAGA